MSSIVLLIKYGCALVAAMLLGNWFLAELRKARATAKPWYAAYVSVPGILILIIIILLPIAVRFF